MATPKIRLNGFEGEWKKIPFSKIANIRRGLTYTPSDINIKGIRVLRSSNINEDTFKLSDDDVFVNENCVNIAYVDNNDILITAANGSPRLVGKHCLIKKSLHEKMVHGGFMLLASSKEAAYVNASMSSRWFRDFQRIGIAGGNGAIGNLNKNLLESYEFYIPDSLKEREAIASYFQFLDTLIQTTAKKIESLKQMKAASLISMFPQEGETTPKVRFKGFEGEWKEVSFKDITYLSGIKNRDNLPMESYSISNELGFIPQNEQFENGGTMSQANKTMYYIVSPDSFAYNPARINVGSIGYYNLQKDVIVSSLYVVFKTDDETYNPFLYIWFKSPMFNKLITLYQEGGVRLYFFYDKLCACKFRRPCFEEQQAIASYFTNLENQISLHTQRLEKIKNIKAECLNKMFV